ncbi:MAG: hypothetical protein AMXMBFR4_08770 [Candidatus Hydrogenedentota bacterium]
MEGELRILLVEDVPTDAELISRELERAGFSFTMTRVEDREEYLSALRTFTPDLILSDYSLPQFDGLTAFRMARELVPGVPFIIVTSSMSEETAVDCMKAGADDYVVKDHLLRLGPAVRSALDRKRREDARHESEAALRVSEERYRQFFEEDLTGDFLAGPDGTIIACNPAFVRMFGLESVEVATGLSIVPFFQSGRHWEELLDLLGRNDRLALWETQLQDVQGKRLYIIANMVCHRDADGRLAQIQGYLFDNTERHLLEEQFRQAQKMEAVGRLAGGIAHDFNNLLSAILGYSDLLLESLSADQEASRDLRTIKDASERAASLTRQLLAFSRRQTMVPRVVDINLITKDLERILSRLIGEDIDVVAQLANEIAPIKIDPSQLEQVILNLAINARDAMPAGGKLTIETANVQLDEDYARRHVGVQPGPYVMLAVSDTGHGMDQETLSRIFEPFFTTKEEGRGTGLGLSTVYGIVKQGGGHIGVYSETGRGTVFKVYFPVLGPDAVEIDMADSVSPASVGGVETVLVAEDDTLVRELAKRVLCAAGYTVFDARTGEGALRVCDLYKGTIQLVLADVVMPSISGLELAKRLRQTRPDTRILFMSGYTGKGVLAQGPLSSNVPFLQKPFTPDALLRAVRRAIDQPHTGFVPA